MSNTTAVPLVLKILSSSAIFIYSMTLRRQKTPCRLQALLHQKTPYRLVALGSVEGSVRNYFIPEKPLAVILYPNR